MTIDPINIGSAPNDGTGQDLRSGGQVINDNFAELDTRTSAAQAKADQGVSDAATAKSAADAARAKADAAVPGAALGVSVAELVNGTVPASQLPSYVDDVLEYPTLADFPATGETGKIYIAINGGDSPTNPTRQYRWSGTAFVLIPASPGSTDQVPEGSTNLYFTAARVRSTLLTGLGGLVNAAILASDTILQAFAKLQGQLNAKLGTGETAADSAKLNGQPASFYTAPMVGATASAPGTKGLAPAPAALGSKPKFLSDDGTYKESSGGASLPVGSLQPWYLPEASIPSGWLQASGQLLDRATWPDLWALFAPYAVTDASWLAAPYLNRGLPSQGNGTTTFRMPDPNGKYSDGNTPAAAVLRGFGKNSAGTPGLFQLDQFQGFNIGNTTWKLSRFTTAYASAGVSADANRSGAYFTTSGVWGSEPVGVPVTDGTNGTPRVGSETRATSVTVIWCIVGSGGTSNSGTVDVQALATQVGNQQVQIDSKPTGSASQLVTAWVNFNGQGTLAIRSGYNVSVAKVSTGVYRITFLTAMANASYAVSVGTSADATTIDNFGAAATTRSAYVPEGEKTTTSFVVRSGANSPSGSAVFDFLALNVIVTGGK